MPLPKPGPGEKQDKFIDRCMDMDLMNEDYPDDKQRLAVCFSQWKKGQKSGDDVMIERRNVEDVEYRFKDEEGNTLTGYAARFGVWSEDLGFFKEKIDPGAFKKTIKENDVRALFNHDPNMILGRTKNNTLELWEDEKGLGFNVNLPATTYASDLKESIRRRDITQNSFGFQTVADEWSKDGSKRTLTEVRLFDISPVTFPAYKQTNVKLRFLELGVDWEELRVAISRFEEGIITDRDQDLILTTIEILKRYLKESEPVAEDHSEADPEPTIVSPDPVTQLKVKIAQMRTRIGRTL
jgi:HK97 family phage prohead protease